jgi:hypothetical protein
MKDRERCYSFIFPGHHTRRYKHSYTRIYKHSYLLFYIYIHIKHRNTQTQNKQTCACTQMFLCEDRTHDLSCNRLYKPLHQIGQIIYSLSRIHIDLVLINQQSVGKRSLHLMDTLLPTHTPLSGVGITCFHHVGIKIRHLFLRPAACLTSILLETGVNANDCKCSRDQQFNVPKHGGAGDNKFWSPIQ